MLTMFCIALLVFAVILNTEANHNEITVEEARGIMANEKDLLLLDVRTQAEFDGELGHLDNALLIPVQELEQRLSELDTFKDKKIIAYCRTGNRSGKAMTFLNKKGFTVVNMLGGMVEWNEKNFPVVRGK